MTAGCSWPLTCTTTLLPTRLSIWRERERERERRGRGRVVVQLLTNTDSEQGVKAWWIATYGRIRHSIACTGSDCIRFPTDIIVLHARGPLILADHRSLSIIATHRRAYTVKATSQKTALSAGTLLLMQLHNTRTLGQRHKITFVCCSFNHLPDLSSVW